MWEINLFKRLFPAFAIIVVGIVFYVMTRYVVNALNSAFTTGGVNTSNWGLATWIFGLFGIIVFWAFLLRAWLVVKGRIRNPFPSDSEPRPKKKKPAFMFPPDEMG